MKPIQLPFNPALMPACELMDAAKTLRGLIQQYEMFHDDPEEFALRFSQILDAYKVT